MTARRTTVRLAAAVLPGLLLLSSCGLVRGNTEGDDPGAETEAEPGDPEAQDTQFVRDGRFGHLGDFRDARAEVTEVAALPDRTRTTVEITPTGDHADDISSGDLKSGMLQDRKITGIRLLDPVQQRLYGVYSDIGTELDISSQWVPGVTYEIVVYSPPLEGDPENITVLTPGSLGEFAGVPVTEGEEETYPSEQPEEEITEGTAEEGDHVVFEVVEEEPEPLEQDWAELYGTVETVVQGREAEDEEETVALRTDVLFDFDSAELTENATDILEEVVEETGERADPERPPITITGHTDGIGEDDYNQNLSEERAEAVHELLETELGDDFEYETEGEGADDPIEREGGDDDAWARAQNRRVELSYAYQDEVPVEPTEDSEDAETEEDVVQPDPSEAGPPAAFHSVEGEDPAGEAETEEGDWSLSVYPFYRDGAYLVTRFEATMSEGSVGHTDNPFGSRHGAFDFSVIDPQSGTIHHDVRRGTADERTRTLAAMNWPPTEEDSGTFYGYMYVPAPPEDVTSMTFDGDDFGHIEDVPILD